MLSSSTKSVVLMTGLAMFSMFFGAGNVVFPLALGQYAQDQNIYAILGLLLTAVGVPFLGLAAMTLFHGNYQSFFNRMGTIPGFLIALVIMALIGPFGALPRCIALSYSTMKPYLPYSLPLFSLFSCGLIYLLTFRKSRILDVLGYVLTPILLVSLLIIIIKGFWTADYLPAAPHSPLTTFVIGLNEGYQTMDLLGAFFFCSVVLTGLKDHVQQEGENYKKLMSLTLKSSCIGAGLLALVYIGFSYVAAFNSEALSGVSKDEILGTIAFHILGPHAGIIAAIAVAFACLTTAIALAVVFAEFLHFQISQEKLSYQYSLIVTLAISFIISTLDFLGIVAFLAPILQVCYPALIMLCLLNIAYKLFHFKPVKLPILIVFTASLVHYIWL